MLTGVITTDETTGELVEGKANSDRTGDGKFNIDDFYELVWAGEWNYEALAELSNAIALEMGGSDSIGIEDRVGFALATGSGLPASGMLYTTSITIVKKEFNGSDYVYSYPNMKETATGDSNWITSPTMLPSSSSTCSARTFPILLATRVLSP